MYAGLIGTAVHVVLWRGIAIAASTPPHKPAKNCPRRGELFRKITRQDRWSYSLILPIDVGLPSIPGGSAPALPVSGPAQRSLSLRPANSPSRLRDPLHQRLQQIRCLLCSFDCYRAERSSSRVGIASTVVQRLARRTVMDGDGVIHPERQIPTTSGATGD